MSVEQAVPILRKIGLTYITGDKPSLKLTPCMPQSNSSLSSP